jgi:hypothetical protein
MPPLILADVSLNPLLREPAQYLMYLLMMFLIVSIVEAFVLWAFKLASFKKSLLGSLLMNLASTVVGFILLILGPFFVLVFLLAPLGVFGAFLISLVLCVLSIAIEAFVLRSLKWTPSKQVWRAVMTANGITYLVPTFFWLLQTLTRS